MGCKEDDDDKFDDDEFDDEKSDTFIIDNLEDDSERLSTAFVPVFLDKPPVCFSSLMLELGSKSSSLRYSESIRNDWKLSCSSLLVLLFSKTKSL